MNSLIVTYKIHTCKSGLQCVLKSRSSNNIGTAAFTGTVGNERVATVSSRPHVLSAGPQSPLLPFTFLSPGGICYSLDRGAWQATVQGVAKSGIATE